MTKSVKRLVEVMNTLRPWLRPQIGLGLIFLALAFATDKVGFFLLGLVLLGAGLQSCASLAEKTGWIATQDYEQEPDGYIFDLRL